MRELEAIRDKPAPYMQINRIDPLSSAVTAVNDRIAGSEREKALLSIDDKLAEINAALNQRHADAGLRNKALYPLQQLKTSVAALNSIPKIRYLAEQAAHQLDTAMDWIAAAQKPEPAGIKKPAGGDTSVTGAGTKPVSPPPKAVKVIHAFECSVKNLSGKRRRYRDLSRQTQREIIDYDSRRQKSQDSISEIHVMDILSTETGGKLQIYLPLLRERIGVRAF